MSLKTRKISSVALQLLLAVALATGTIASATPLAGQFNFSGTADVSLLGVDYTPPVGGGVGEIVVLPGGNTGDFASLNTGVSFGEILDRDESSQPVGSNISVPNWLTLAAMPNLSFTLEFIAPGVFNSAQCFAGAANQQTCTPPPFDADGPGGNPAIISPYNLTNSTNTTGGINSTASFVVSGQVMDTNTGELGVFRGIFNATFQDTPYQELLAAVLSGGTVTAPFSAQITVTAIPEPSSMALALGGAALLGAGLLRRRRR
jgi:hypothetical protein